MARERLSGELEWTILEHVKARGEVSVKEICEVLSPSVEYTTVMTVMARLAEKGALVRRREGRYYLYQLAKKGKTSSLGLVERLKERLFGGQAVAMIRYLLDSSEDITPQDLEEMKTLLRDYKAKQKEKND